MLFSASPKLFVNLAVRDLNRSIAFFERLGFEFDPNLTDDQAACLMVNTGTCVVFSAVGEASSLHGRGLNGFAFGSRSEVDELMRKALEAGGTQAVAPLERRFVYVCSFHDLDRHQWDVVWFKDPGTRSWQLDVLRKLKDLGLGTLE